MSDLIAQIQMAQKTQPEASQADPSAVGIPVHRPVGRLASERATGDVVMREIAAMHAAGLRTLRANALAERLWPGRRQHNANGQVFPLGAAVAARLLRKCPAVREKEWRLWEILPHRLPVGRLVDRRKDTMTYEQLADGRWVHKDVPREYEPQAVQCWYMRDNHTFRPLPLDVGGALEAMREERDAGHTCGMLCGKPGCALPPVVHARGAEEWAAFEVAARAWLEAAVEASKPRRW